MKRLFADSAVGRLLIIIGATILISWIQLSGCQKKQVNTGGAVQPPVEPPVTGSAVAMWMTSGDQYNLFRKQNVALNWGSQVNGNLTISIDSTQKFQTIDGFGFTLTGGSADLINGMMPAARADLLKELFATDSNFIGVSYLRVSIGASDLSASVFSYDDMPSGQTDAALQHFSLGIDTVNLVPVLQQILAINPGIKILGSPWSAPTWMKTNSSSVGGSLLPAYYTSYANYFVKYVQAMKARGITIDAITVQNEPLHGGNNPSMVMTASEQAVFVKNHLGPAFQAAGIATKIIVWDHNCDRPDYPIEVLNDAAAKQFIDGSAFHLYGGDISALSTVRNAHPEKNIYFTEQYTASTGDFAGDLRWHVKNVVIGSVRNWSRNALEWNLANNPTFGPHTSGGCTTCKGAVTIGPSIQRNVAYYIIAQASKFVRPGSVRVSSNIAGSLHNVAFVTPEGRKVVIVVNDGNNAQTFNIKFKEQWIVTTLDAGAVGTYVW